MKNGKYSLKRFPFISWLILPIVGVLLATNYMLGITRKPTWAIIDEPVPLMQETKSQDFPVQKSENYIWKGNGLVTLWFDDAWISQYTVAFPILQSIGLKAALAVPTGAIGWDGYMTWPQIKRLSVNGWEITSHSRSHECDLDQLGKDKIEDEFVGSKKDLLEKGFNADIYVTPCGKSSPEIMEVAKNNYIALRTVEEGLNSIPLTDTYNISVHEINKNTTIADVKNWMNEAEISKKWLILMFHQIDDSLEEYAADPQFFKQIVDTVSESGLDVVFPSQVLNLTLH